VIKTLADELGPSGIRINGLLPARIATDRVREFDALSGDPDELRARQSELIPLRTYGEPEEFVRAAAFVLSPAASYMTGRNDPPSMPVRSAQFEPTPAPFLASDRPVETQRDVTVSGATARSRPDRAECRGLTSRTSSRRTVSPAGSACDNRSSPEPGSDTRAAEIVGRAPASCSATSTADSAPRRPAPRAKARTTAPAGPVA
jgi:hypothetical protein